VETWWQILPESGEAEKAFWADEEEAMQAAYHLGEEGKSGMIRLFYWDGQLWNEVRFPFYEHGNPSGYYPEGW
jgi:hypothetical protein